MQSYTWFSMLVAIQHLEVQDCKSKQIVQSCVQFWQYYTTYNYLSAMVPPWYHLPPWLPTPVDASQLPNLVMMDKDHHYNITITRYCKWNNLKWGKIVCTRPSFVKITVCWLQNNVSHVFIKKTIYCQGIKKLSFYNVLVSLFNQLIF